MIKNCLVAAGLLGGMLAPTAAQAAPIPSATGRPGHSGASAQDHDFLVAVHQANLAEIAGGHIAARRANDPQVRALAVRFVADHTKIDAGLSKVARQLHVALPAEPNPAQQALAKRYEDTPATAFDRLYLSTQLTAHEEAMAAGKTELTKGENLKVKRLVVSAGPIVMAHHTAILALEKTVGAAGHGHHHS